MCLTGQTEIDKEKLIVGHQNDIIEIVQTRFKCHGLTVVWQIKREKKKENLFILSYLKCLFRMLYIPS
jgi:hypothetical protein